MWKGCGRPRSGMVNIIRICTKCNFSCRLALRCKHLVDESFSEAVSKQNFICKDGQKSSKGISSLFAAEILEN